MTQMRISHPARIGVQADTGTDHQRDGSGNFSADRIGITKSRMCV